MRDCLFLVADKNMEGMIKGFFSRENFHLSLGCGNFDFNSKHDLKVAHGQNDPGLYTRAGELLQPYASEYRHVVVIVDAEWDGSPGAELIQKRMNEHLELAGWAKDKGCAVVIDPELENWVWQDNPHVCESIEFNKTFSELRTKLEMAGFWDAGSVKPIRPKEAFEWALRNSKKARSSAIYQQLASGVSTKNCSDISFGKLRTALQVWFPLAS